MTLDLHSITANWPEGRGGTFARVINGQDGRSVVQLRIELGVLQMFPDGRPDGGRYRSAEDALHYAQDCMDEGRTLVAEDWQELRRELQQFNYRRVAFTALVEMALTDSADADARAHLVRCVRDIDHCLRILQALEEGCPDGAGSQAMMFPTLIYNRARQLAQLRAVEGRFEEAIGEAEAGANALERLFAERAPEGGEDVQRPGVSQLRDLAEELRRRAEGDGDDLESQLRLAIEQEDFETAAKLRDQLRARDDNGKQPDSE